MEEFEKLESLIGQGKSYVATRYDETRLALAEKSVRMISFSATRTIIGAVFGVSLLFASAAAAIAIGDWLGAEWKGFLVMAGIYFILGWIIVAARESLIRIPVMNALIRQLFKNEYSDEED